MVSEHTKLGSLVGHDAKKRNNAHFIHWDHSLIIHICCHKCILSLIKFNLSYYCIYVNERLLIDPANTFNGTCIICILCAKITWMMNIRIYAKFSVFSKKILN